MKLEGVSLNETILDASCGQDVTSGMLPNPPRFCGSEEGMLNGGGSSSVGSSSGDRKKSGFELGHPPSAISERPAKASSFRDMS
mmetsp:Transcript_22706/g.45655  ORF Transcript_22706/g.45655 Transcript_22706/m.45655 type:complete len:84 (-) Transcript_22706:21-272(-)